MEKYFIAGGLLVALVGIFILTYILNKKTKKPEGCDEEITECIGCKVTLCPKHPEKKDKKEN